MDIVLRWIDVVWRQLSECLLGQLHSGFDLLCLYFLQPHHEKYNSCHIVLLFKSILSNEQFDERKQY